MAGQREGVEGRREVPRHVFAQPVEARERPEIVALLGPPDQPTDAVEDYCARLAEALAVRGLDLSLARVPWRGLGLGRAFDWLRRASGAWQGQWVLVQYTPMMWPLHGFPLGLLAVTGILRRRRCQVALVLHDPLPFPGSRPQDRARRLVQVWVTRQAARRSHAVVCTVPPERVACARDVRATLIPVGSNIPIPTGMPESAAPGPDPPRTVVVFGVTGGRGIPSSVTECEVGDMAHALRRASTAVSSLRLVVLGRGADEARDQVFRAFDGTGIRVSVRGLLPAAEISRILTSADALLCPRAHVSTRRTTAVAGIACGVPVVGYEGPETGYPITEAGVLLAPLGDREALARGLTQVLSDGDLWQKLRRRNVAAYRRYFSWDVIAGQYCRVLGYA